MGSGAAAGAVAVDSGVGIGEMSVFGVTAAGGSRLAAVEGSGRETEGFPAGGAVACPDSPDDSGIAGASPGASMGEAGSAASVGRPSAFDRASPGAVAPGCPESRVLVSSAAGARGESAASAGGGGGALNACCSAALSLSRARTAGILPPWSGVPGLAPAWSSPLITFICLVKRSARDSPAVSQNRLTA